MRRLIVSLLVVLMIMAVVLGACSSPAPTPAPAPSTSAAPKPTTAPPPPATSAAATTPAAPATTAAPAANIPTMKLRVSSPWGTPDTFTPSEATVKWAKEITDKSGGKITFEFFWAAALAGSAETADLTGKGAIDVALITPAWTESKFPIGLPESVIPFYSNDPALTMKMRDQLDKDVPAYEKMWSGANLKYLMGMPSEDYGWNFTTEVKTFADFKGKKISQPGRWTAEWMKVSGATFVSTNVNQTYELMQSRVIDANMLPISSNYSTKVYEVAKYFLHGFGIQVNRMLFMNNATYAKLEPDGQKIVNDASKAMLTWYPPMMVAGETQMREAMKKTGVVFNVMATEERAKWLAAVTDTPAAFAAEMETKGFPGWDIMAKVQSISTNLGYKFERKWAVKP